MSQWLACLKEENFKLRSEARALKENLKLVKTCKRLKELTEERRKKVPSCIHNEFEYREPKKNCYKRKEFELYEDPNKENKNSGNIKLSNSKLQKKANSFSINQNTYIPNSKKNTNCDSKGAKHQACSSNIDNSRTLLDSLESYYEFEEENLEKTGKCSLSYTKYKSIDKNQKRYSQKHKSKNFTNIEPRPKSIDIRTTLQQSQKFALKLTPDHDHSFHHNPCNSIISKRLLKP